MISGSFMSRQKDLHIKASILSKWRLVKVATEKPSERAVEEIRRSWAPTWNPFPSKLAHISAYSLAVPRSNG